MWLPEFSRDFRAPTNVLHSPPAKPMREHSYHAACVRILANYIMQSRTWRIQKLKATPHVHWFCRLLFGHMAIILAEGAIALSVTHSGGALFASWKLFQFPSSLIVKVILAIFMGASAQHLQNTIPQSATRKRSVVAVLVATTVSYYVSWLRC